MKSINNVEYIGFVESLDDFYGNIDAILSTVTKECGVINRILEAWGYGKIAIGFRKNFLPFVDAVEYTNYYCAEKPEEFLKVIKELQRSQDSLYRKGEASVKLVKEQYTWEKSANNFVEIFKRLNA